MEYLIAYLAVVVLFVISVGYLDRKNGYYYDTSGLVFVGLFWPVVIPCFFLVYFLETLFKLGQKLHDFLHKKDENNEPLQ